MGNLGCLSKRATTKVGGSKLNLGVACTPVPSCSPAKERLLLSARAIQSDRAERQGETDRVAATLLVASQCSVFRVPPYWMFSY